MKVILLADVKSVGKKGDVCEVSDAYARNVLIRKKLGAEATSRNLNDLKLQKANDDKLAAERLAEAKKLKERLEKSKITLKVKVGEGGKLFGSISNGQVADAVKEQLGLEIDKKKVSMNPIKSVGSMTAVVKLHPQVSADLAIEVESL